MLLSLVAHAIGYKMMVGTHNIVVVRHMWEVLPYSPCMVDDDVHNAVDVQRHVEGALPRLSGMGVDGAHNNVGKISAPTTLLGFYHSRKVAGYCPVGAQGMVLGITVDLSALPYLLRPFPGPHRAGVPGRLVLVSFDYASRRRAVSRSSVHPRSETWVGVRSGVWPGLLVRETGQSWKRALFLLG